MCILSVLYNKVKTVFDRIKKREQATETIILEDSNENCNITLQLVSFGLIKPHLIHMVTMQT